MHQQQGSDWRGPVSAGKGGMGEKLVREENHLGRVWSNAVGRHGDVRREQTSTALKGKNRDGSALDGPPCAMATAQMGCGKACGSLCVRMLS